MPSSASQLYCAVTCCRQLTSGGELSHVCLLALMIVPEISGTAVRAWLKRVTAEPGHVSMDYNATATIPAL